MYWDIPIHALFHVDNIVNIYMLSPLQKFIDKIKKSGSENIQKIKNLFTKNGQSTFTGSVGRESLKSLLSNNVCEIRFVRRHPKFGYKMTRQMVATNCLEILESTNAKISLNYRRPTKARQINHDRYNLVLVWDILMQDYRCIPMESCVVLNTVYKDNFWYFYNNVLYPMSSRDKLTYMDH